MVRRNQHILDARHLVVSMNEWLLYDLSGVELKPLQKTGLTLFMV